MGEERARNVGLEERDGDGRAKLGGGDGEPKFRAGTSFPRAPEEAR